MVNYIARSVIRQVDLRHFYSILRFQLGLYINFIFEFLYFFALIYIFFIL